MSIVQQSTTRVQIPGSEIDRKSRDEDSIGMDEMSRENTGRWTQEEHNMFLQGLKDHGKGWKKIASLIKTRTVVQIRTHAQKYFQKLSKAKQGDVVPLSMDVRSTASSPRKTKKKTAFTPMKPTNVSKPVALPHHLPMQQHGLRSGVVPTQNVMVQQAVYMNGANSNVPAPGMMISLPTNAPMDTGVSLEKIVVPSSNIGSEASPVSVSDMGFMYPNSGPGTPSSGHQSPVPQYQYLQQNSGVRGQSVNGMVKPMYSAVERPSLQTSASGGGWSHAIAASAQALVSDQAPAPAGLDLDASDMEAFLGGVQTEDLDWLAQDSGSNAASEETSTSVVGSSMSSDLKRPSDSEEDGPSGKRRRVGSSSLAPDASIAGSSVAPYSTFSDAKAVASISPVATSSRQLSSAASDAGSDSSLDFLWEDDEPLNLDDVFRNCLDEHVFNASLLCGGGLEGVF